MCVVALSAISAPAILERGAQLRVEPDRLVEIGDGAGVVALDEIGAAATAESTRILRIEPDRFVEIRRLWNVTFCDSRSKPCFIFKAQSADACEGRGAYSRRAR